MNIIRFWYTNARPTSLPQSLLPSVLAVCLSVASPAFSWWLAVAAVAGVVAAHLSLNLFDDYFDYRKNRTDYRDHMAHEGIRARIGKCTYLTSGKATLRQLRTASICFLLTALALGAVIFYFRGMVILYIAVTVAVLGISYSAPPLRLSYHGLGELVIGFIFGPMNMLGTYYAACGEIKGNIILLSVPVGLWVMNIVYVHSILDFIPDKKIGKRTFAVLLNRTVAMLAALFLILFSPYAILTYGILSGNLSPYYGLLFLTLPMAVSLFYMMVEYVRRPQRQFTPKWWMGPMNNWKRIRNAGIDWFMIRWLLARNLLSAFCLIVIVLNFTV
ncbi:MAG: prenyltransferase [Bacteroidales bacterium]|jgi:1,4-dihydroxy-2-naphthoate octaprenyltransferase|nr:prenyltransferase [Bacteroidales bacterium]